MGLARILVADPDPRALALTVTGLRNAGFDVLSTSRGEEALALLQSLPAAVFCEVGLEGVDGFALCEAAHKSPATKDVPFFLMSRRDERGHRERARAAGARDYLTKPLYLRDVCTLAKLFAHQHPDEPLIRGDLGATPLFYVVRALTSGSLSGTVEVPHEQGVVYFRDGRVIEAVAGDLKGDAAIGKLIVRAQGEFSLRLGPVLVRGSMSYSLRDLISHDEPRRRRFERAVESMGGHETRLTIHFPTLASELPRLPPSVERVVRLFDGKRALGDVLRACDLDEVTAAETILRLFAMRVIRPAAELLSGPTTELPRLFEPRPDEAILAMKDLFPDAAPLPTEKQLEGIHDDVSDWLGELGQGTFQDILTAGTGGWLELPASQAGQRLREAVGELSETEIEDRLGGFDALGSDAPPTGAPPPAAAAEPEAIAPDSIAAAVASAPQGEEEQPATAVGSAREEAGFASVCAALESVESASPEAPAGEPSPTAPHAPAVAPRDAEERDESGPPPSALESAQESAGSGMPAPERGEKSETALPPTAAPAPAKPLASANAEAPETRGSEQKGLEVSSVETGREPSGALALPSSARGDAGAARQTSAAEPSPPVGPSEASRGERPAPDAAGLAQDLAAYCLERLSGQALGPGDAGPATGPASEAGGNAESPAAEAAPAAGAAASLSSALAAPAALRPSETESSAERPHAQGTLGTSAAQPAADPVAARGGEPDEDAFFNSEPGFDEPGPPSSANAKRVVVVFAVLAFALVAVLLAISPSKSRLPQGGQPLGAEPTSPAATVATPAPEPDEPAALPGAAAQQAAPDEDRLAANAPLAPDDSPASTRLAADPSVQAGASSEEGDEKPAAGESAAADPTAQGVGAVAGQDAPAATAPELPLGAQQKPGPRPGEIDELLAQGRKLYDRGRPKAALEPLEKAAELAPGNPDVQVLLALARLDAGQLGPAEQAARRALELDASTARAHLVLGTVCQERGDTKSARSEYEEYLRLAPSGDFAKDVQAILSSLR